jgi:ABC-type transport system involved in cytochrome c biogenesis permease subunit
MVQLEIISFNICLIITILSVIISIFRLVYLNIKKSSVTPSALKILTNINLSVLLLAFLSISVSLISRTISTGHGPFSNMYEFAIAFVWGVILIGIIFWFRYKMPMIGLISSIISTGLLIFAWNLSSQANPLMPALQQSWLLTTHVASAVISYGAFAIGFGTSLAYLVQSKSPEVSENLDKISYHSVLIGFPFLTLVIILGALWADIAWGRYWSWDPKETASLVTWLLYASYLHTRVLRRWRGKRSAILMVAGFLAVLITFFGNYIFKGLHSY